MEYFIMIPGRPDFCGIGPIGVPFAMGRGMTESLYAAEWYRSHGYYVSEEDEDDLDD